MTIFGQCRNVLNNKGSSIFLEGGREVQWLWNLLTTFPQCGIPVIKFHV